MRISHSASASFVSSVKPSQSQQPWRYHLMSPTEQPPYQARCGTLSRRLISLPPWSQILMDHVNASNISVRLLHLQLILYGIFGCPDFLLASWKYGRITSFCRRYHIRKTPMTYCLTCTWWYFREVSGSQSALLEYHRHLFRFVTSPRRLDYDLIPYTFEGILQIRSANTRTQGHLPRKD